MNKAGGVDALHSIRQGEASKAGTSSGPAKSGAEGSSATIDVSATASMLGSAMARLAELPEIREDVVATYKELVDSGQYQRADELIAEAMIRDEG